MVLVVGHLVEDLACVEEEPKPSGALWGLGGEEGRVPEVVGPAVGVVDLEEGRNLEEAVLGAAVPLVVDQTDRGR